MKSRGLSCSLITQASSARGGPPFSAVCWREVQSLIAAPQDKQVTTKKGGWVREGI